LSGDRVPTGIEGFDSLIEGGIPRGSLVLLAGNAGSGKTIFSAQYLYHGASKLEEPGLYVSFAESRETFLKNMKRMNMDFERYEQEGRLKFIDLVTVTEKGIGEILTSILEEISALKAKRLVIDSFSALAQAFKAPIDARIVLHTILGKMVRQAGSTTLLVVEMPMNEERMGLGIEEFVADGVIAMTLASKRGYLDRRLQILKMRGTKTSKALLRYDIDEHGIRVYTEPEMALVEKVFREKMSTGIEGLDKMLNGGVYKGSATMVAGASGTGKTTAALHFIIEGAKRNEKGVYISFEEPAAQLVKHGEGFGWNMKELIDDGAIKIASYYPERYGFEEHLLQVRRLLHESKPVRFVIDSLTPLERVLSEDEYIRYVKSLRSYLKAEGVTSLFTFGYG